MSLRTVAAFAGATIILVALLLVGGAFWIAAHPTVLLPLVSTRLPPELEISELSGLVLRADGGDIARAAFTFEGNAVAVRDLRWAWRLESLWPPRIAPTSVRAHSVDLRLADAGAPPPSPRPPLPRFRENPYWPTIAALGLGIEELHVSDAAGQTVLAGRIETGADTRTGRARLRLALTGNELLLQWQRSGDAEWLLDWESGAPYPAAGRLTLSAGATSVNWMLQAVSPGVLVGDQRFEQISLQGSGTTDLFEGVAPLLLGRLAVEASMAAESGAVVWKCEAAVATAQDLGSVVELERVAARQGSATLDATPALKIVLDARGELQSVAIGDARVELREAGREDWRIRELTLEAPAAPVWTRDSEVWVLPTTSYRFAADNAALDVTVRSSGQARETKLRPDGRHATRLGGTLEARYAKHAVAPLDYSLSVELDAAGAATEGSLNAPGLGRLVSFRTRTELESGVSELRARVDTTSWNWGKGLLRELLGPKQSLIAGDLMDAALQLDVTATMSPDRWSATVGGAVERASGLFRGIGIAGLAVAPFQLSFRNNAPVSTHPVSWRVGALNAGIAVSELRGELVLKDDSWQLLDIQGSLFGGTLSMKELDRPDREGPLGTVHVEGIDLARVTALLDNPDLTVTGRIDGDIPLYISGGALTVQGGRLHSSEGGIIRYRPQTAASDASSVNSQIALVRDALSNLVFDSLDAGVEYAASGDLVLRTEIRGRNPELDPSRPVHLNLTVEDNILTLMRSLRAGDRVSEWLGRRIEERKR